jgi:hypothetical protein
MYLGLIDVFRIKQIRMVAMLGLALVLVTAAVYTQSAHASGRCCGDNGVNPGGPMVPAGGGYNGGNGIHITFGPCHEIAPGRYVC